MADDKKNYLIFQCYGNTSILMECAFALLSLQDLYGESLPSGLEIWIYTDNPDWFRSFKECRLPLNFRQIDAETIKSWRGKIDFTHRLKIELLRDFSQNHTGNLLYCDSDVVFQRRLEPIFSNIGGGELYMHTMEGQIGKSSSPVLKKLNKHFAGRKAANDILISEFAMWNAGVLGFCTAYKHLLEEALQFTDTEYPVYPKHIVEQFAFSLFFQQQKQIKSAEHTIIHYWNLKELRSILNSFFNYFKTASWPELVQYHRLINVPVLMQEKANFYKNRSIKHKLLKQNWTPSLPDWERKLTEM